MAEYCRPIEKSFVCRTNKLIQEYKGRYDATMLLNCLLGLLVVPFENIMSIVKMKNALLLLEICLINYKQTADIIATGMTTMISAYCAA